MRGSPVASIQDAADQSIRRACAFAGLGIAMVMLALSYSLGLALRSGGNMTALLCLGLLVCAWRAPRRDVRQTELWTMLEGDGAFARTLPRSQAQKLLSGVLRDRLLWHADRVGTVALVLWLAALPVLLLR